MQPCNCTIHSTREEQDFYAYRHLQVTLKTGAAPALPLDNFVVEDTPRGIPAVLLTPTKTQSSKMSTNVGSKLTPAKATGAVANVTNLTPRKTSIAVDTSKLAIHAAPAPELASQPGNRVKGKAYMLELFIALYYISLATIAFT
jgi:hypothetical protein